MSTEVNKRPKEKCKVLVEVEAMQREKRLINIHRLKRCEDHVN